MNTTKYLWLVMIIFQLKLFANEQVLQPLPAKTAAEQDKAVPFSYWGFTPGYHLDLGSLNIHSDAADEINKTGTIVSAGAYALRREKRQHIHLGLGLSYAYAAGKSEARGLKQSLAMLGIYVDSGWSYHLGSQIFVGSYLRMVMGKGAWFDDAANRLDLSLNLMPTLEYLWDKQSTQTRFQLSWARSLNNPERVAQSIVLGINLTFDRIVLPEEPRKSNGIELERVEKPNSVQLPSHDKKALPLAPANTGISESLAVHFSDGSIELTAEARETLSALAQVLFKYKTAWKRIHVIAYQDPMHGVTKDSELSEARMKNIRAYLEADGLPRNRLKTMIVSSRQAGSKLDTMEARENLVDLEIRDMQGRDSWELRRALDALIAKPKKQQ